MSAKTIPVSAFKGLNNIADPLTLGASWLTVAENVDITEAGSVLRRDGYSKVLDAAPSGAYVTADYARTYLSNGNLLLRLYDDMSTRIVAGLTSTAPLYFTEVNGDVFYSNGIDKGIIRPDDALLAWDWPTPDTPDLAAVTGNLPQGQYQVLCTFFLPDGRETGSGVAAALTVDEGSALQITNIPQLPGLTTALYIAPANSEVFQFAFTTTRTAETWNASPDALGSELTTLLLNPPPETATVPMMWQGRAYLMEYLPNLDATVVWMSEPLGFHLFNLDETFLQVPGRGTLLAPTEGGLIIATERTIHLWDGDKLDRLADYGCVSPCGWAIDDDHKTGTDSGAVTYLWTTRGVCRAFPFANLTSSNFSVSSGASAGAAIVKKNGHKRFVVALEQGGAAFNKRS